MITTRLGTIIAIAVLALAAQARSEDVTCWRGETTVRTIHDYASVGAVLEAGQKTLAVTLLDKPWDKPGLMMPDDLHPNAGGYEIWLDEMCPVVDRLLECQEKATK